MHRGCHILLPGRRCKPSIRDVPGEWRRSGRRACSAASGGAPFVARLAVNLAHTAEGEEFLGTSLFLACNIIMQQNVSCVAFPMNPQPPHLSPYGRPVDPERDGGIPPAPPVC